jgi:cell division protein FtsL
MSQKKVDAYKSQKAKRDKIAKKEKLELILEAAIGILIAVVMVVWIGYSVYDKVTETDETETVVAETTINTSALDDYVSGLSATDAE